MILSDASAAKIFSAHWHPFQNVSPVTRPHVHVGELRLPQLQGLHIPTPRLSVEQFIEFAIRSFGAQPTVDEATWKPLLDKSHARHALWRTWQNHDEAPFSDGKIS